MIISLLKLILVVPFVLVLPGFFLELAAFGWKSKNMSFFERAVLAVPLSIVSVDLLILLINKMGILIRGPVIAGSVIIFCLACFAIYKYRFGKNKKDSTSEEESEKYFNFSTWQTTFIIISIFLSVFIRTTYLTDTIVPSATDLGHHMYWTQTIVDSGKLPSYGMPDFIIGEHMIFAAVNLLSGVGVMTAMPILVLLLINIVGIFAVAILAGRIFEKRKIVAAAIFSTGLLYAVGPPQAKYVSGGVIGNIIGDTLIPICLYFLYRAFAEKNQLFAGLFLFSFAGLLYAHHLSAFILIFSIVAIVAMYLIANIDKIFAVISDWFKIFLRPFPLAMLVLLTIFFLFIFTPSYFNPASLSQATGTPTKVTRVGLSVGQIESNIGSARLILGLFAALFLIYAFKRRDYKYSFVLGWTAILFVMSWKPKLLLVNIPSDRVGNYLFLPFALLSAFGLIVFFELFQKSATKFFSSILLFILLFFVVTDGLADSADAFHQKNQFQQAIETFHSAKYLAATVDTSRDNILKDHNGIYGDTWFKLFFMKDYKYPLSRGVLTRYNDPTKNRETCTLDMISAPESDHGKACFAETGVDYVVLNAQAEGTSFEKLPDFSEVYDSNYLSIFKRNEQ